MSEMHKTKIVIASNEYRIESEEPSEYVLTLAEALNAKIEQISSQGQTLSFTDTLILSALDIIDELEKLKKTKPEDCPASDAAEQLVAYKEVIIALNRELDSVKRQNKQLAAQLKHMEEEKAEQAVDTQNQQNAQSDSDPISLNE